jgi:hypothetical protein
MATAFKWNELNNAMPPLAPPPGAWADPTAPVEAEAPPQPKGSPWATPATAETAPKPSPSPWQPVNNASEDAQIAKDRTQLQKLQTPDTLASHPGFWGKVGHGLARVGDAIGTALVPGVMQNFPGTSLGRAEETRYLAHHISEEENQRAENQQRRGILQKTQQEVEEEPQKAADTHALTEAQIGNYASEDWARKHPNSPLTHFATDDGFFSFNPQTGHVAPLTFNGQPVASPKKLIQSQPIMGPDGKPHTYMLDQHGNKVQDLGVHYERPIINNTGDNHLFQEQERGRGLLDKAEGEYRSAQQGASTMRDMLDQADAGNRMSAQMLPLEGALAITTAQGVHRINRTEVDQFAGGGSLYDRIAGELGKVSEGQPIPKNIRNDIRKLTDMQEKAAYSKYKGAHESATQRYHLTDEKPLPAPGGGEPASQHKVGDTVNLGGRTVRIKKIYPDGTFDY